MLNAHKGSGSSFVWIGLWESKEHLRKGFRWVLSDGESIKIFKNPWLRGKNNYYVVDSQLNDNKNENAYDYICPNSKAWDVQKVHQVFHTEDVP